MSSDMWPPEPKCRYHGDACPFTQRGDADLEAEIIAWYKALPEITLPNTDSSDGTFMELNVVDLAKFIQAREQQAYERGKVDEAKICAKASRHYREKARQQLPDPSTLNDPPEIDLSNEIVKGTEKQ